MELLVYPRNPTKATSPNGTIDAVPVFEYRCKNCGAKFRALIGMVAEPDDDRCPQCGSAETDRLVSRFARRRSEDDRIDEMADKLEAGGEPQSATEMRSIMREMGHAMDEDMADEMEEIFEADMAGELEEDN